MAIKAIIFDCFGVLVISGSVSVQHDYPHLAVELHDLTMRSDYGYITRSEFDKELSDLTAISLDDIEARYWAKNVRNEPVFAWVRSIKSAGEYKLGLLTNIGKEWLDDFLLPTERHDLFNKEVLSGEVGMTKPDVRIYELLAQKLGVETSECVMIDDLLQNVEGAARAGMATVLFGSLSQAQEDLNRVLAHHA
jgi:epoxide hydrolase-like predicted phosphatase